VVSAYLAMSLNHLFPTTWRVRLGWRSALLSAWVLLIGPAVILAESASSTSGSPANTPVAEGKISLEATTRKRLPNTVADVVLAIQVEGRTVDAVSSQLSQRSHTLLDFLRQQEVERLRTEDLAYEPETEPVRGGPDKIVGYNGHASVSFRTTPEKLGALLTGALENGANTVSQTVFSPKETEIDAARQDLAIEATKTALARADAIAQAVGQRVVRVQNINVASEGGILPLQFRAAKAALPSPASSVETAPGEQEISVRVSVEVGIVKADDK
jgi:uncharacterized protein